MSSKLRLAIRPEEFCKALKSILSHHSGDGIKGLKFGLAISGGSDSIALAHLFRRYIEDASEGAVDFNAFIVDHKSRADSSEEAKRVAELTTQILGTKAKILTLKWHNEPKSASLNNFESIARRLRYQALAKACDQHGISHLLLGHHADDVAETVLTRLSQCHSRTGLRGISKCAQIPHCEGMYGIYESGGLKPPAHLNTGHEPPVGAEDGGLMIARPLLGFSKERLVATCEQAKITWINDPTNHDPTFTVRNTVRSLLQSQKLPVALRSESLRSFAQRCSIVAANEDSAVNSLVSKCIVKSLDLRSGLMRILIPQDLALVKNSKGSISQARIRINVEASRRILDMVSPMEIIETRNLRNLQTLLFSNNSISSEVTTYKRFTFGGVLIEKLSSKLTSSSTVVRPFIEWQISRQPYHRRSKLPLTECLSLTTRKKESNFMTDLQAQGRGNDRTARFDGAVRLWDGRYWIDVHHSLPWPVQVVPLTAARAKNLTDSAKRGNNFNLGLRHEMKKCTSPRNRWILPSLVTKDPMCESELILAAPSLGIVHPGWENKLSWSISYKKISFPDLIQDVHQPYILRSRSQSQNLDYQITSIYPNS